MHVLDAFEDAHVVPVVTVSGADEGDNLASALKAGGLPIAEVTLRMPYALDALRSVATKHPDVLVGCGTVISVRQVDEAVDAGAQFIVSPGTWEPVVRRAQQRGVEVIPGIASASDIMRARDLGISCVKVFPASSIGGPDALRELMAPFPGLRFIPTGGITEENLAEYLELPPVLAAGISWNVDRGHIEAGHWDEITRQTQEAVALAAMVTPAPDDF
ncbi:MAG: bifunctional 4-hydroxy-2-oxoglutarate aldolase/2-dehydro-3-deoxy-phosphogluconate aldolase [Cellulomonadaceae bacterium]|jgi:2-dehydro-3-deoxyphosphogluconate aldolase/(4S)-4-hydroxy-2-oxoglutarate aldolase|nr:bifunctional 4-hydroxy-2-oxoglutarate aldolase/2-dehydro-3-deoxy-phosphogluconate aldolase [Cellulomonadaceae bacterium]